MRPMITGAYPLDRAREAFELASDRKRAMKVLLDFCASRQLDLNPEHVEAP